MEWFLIIIPSEVLILCAKFQTIITISDQYKYSVDTSSHYNF